MEDSPMPEVGVNDVLIKVSKTAICGTDLHIYKWDEWSQNTIKTPMITGHEFSGEVVEFGAGVQGFEAGDRVTAEGHIVCGVCRNCRKGLAHLCPNTVGIGVNRNGAFAEYISVPYTNVIKVDDAISYEMAAIFDPLGNAVHSALSFPLISEDVLITGAGLIGNMAVAICKFVGARHVVVTDVNEHRLEIAKQMGATRVVNPQKENLKEIMQELDMQNGFDVGLEMSGAPQAFNLMLETMFHGGKISLLGILPNDTQINWSKVIFKGLVLKGIYGREMYESWYQMEQLIKNGLDVSPMITHKFKADDFQKAFDVMVSGKCGKVILDWD